MPQHPWLLLLLLALAAAGCDAPAARFHLNMAFLRKQEREVGSDFRFTRGQRQDVADILTAMFGTPDDPHVPTQGSSGIDQLFTAEDRVKLQMAAGPVSSDQAGTPRGLYRQHCAHCHGISGDGLGPTAVFLKPYPRDYRMGIFKFKSTPRGSRPTHADLTQIVISGIPGTAMPSFSLLPDDEIEALVAYVKYLSIRGQLERVLVRDLALEFEGEKDRPRYMAADYLLDDLLGRVVQPWLDAETQHTPIAPLPEMFNQQQQASIERGRQLYYGTVANCVKCHGDTQLGDGQNTDYDDWTKDFFDWTNASESAKREMTAELISLGGLQPRTTDPRNLRQGIYRGGRRPIDLYRRIHDGIDGTPMPASLMKPPGAPADAVGLTTDDIWHLVHYVQSLPYEPASQPGARAPEYQRERM
jgi:mono/diheme cytochrome c family protein